MNRSIESLHNTIGPVNTPSSSLRFCQGSANTIVGQLTWDEGALKFEGNADESAQIFLESVAKISGMSLSINTTKPSE